MGSFQSRYATPGFWNEGEEKQQRLTFSHFGLSDVLSDSIGYQFSSSIPELPQKQDLMHCSYTKPLVAGQRP